MIPQRAQAWRSPAPSWVRALRHINQNFSVQVTDPHAEASYQEPSVTLYKWWPGGRSTLHIRTEAHWDRIKEIIETEDVALFMKGTPQFVMCGNSQRALDALRRAGAPVTAVDILPDPRIRQDLSALSGWPTIPQVFVRGELIGGADIVEELEASGELERTLAEKLGDDYRGAGQERVAAVA